MRDTNAILLLLAASVALMAMGCGGGGGRDVSAPAIPEAPANSAPAINHVPDQVVDEDGLSAPIKVVLSDAETPAGDLQLSVVSSDPMLLPDTGIDVLGQGDERTLTLIPAAGQTGAAEVSLDVTDGDGATVRQTFRLTVNPLYRAEFADWLRDTVLAQGELDPAIGELHDDDTPLSDVENLLRIRFSDRTSEDPEAYDDLLAAGD